MRVAWRSFSSSFFRQSLCDLKSAPEPHPNAAKNAPRLKQVVAAPHGHNHPSLLDVVDQIRRGQAIIVFETISRPRVIDHLIGKR